MSAALQELTDGDTGFSGVMAFATPGPLPPGKVHRALNQAFEGRTIRARPGIIRPPWGAGELGSSYQSGAYFRQSAAEPNKYVINAPLPESWQASGRTYRRFYSEVIQAFGGNDLIPMEGGGVLTDEVGVPLLREGADGSMDDLGRVLNDDHGVWELSAGENGEDGEWIKFQHVGLAPVEGTALAGARWNDPAGLDGNVIVTAEDRASDGGRGRAWWVKPGNLMSEISLNGQDVWGTCRLVQAGNMLLLLRHGNQRHYCAGTAVSTNRVQLNAPATFEDTNRVRFIGDEGAMSPLMHNAHYWVKLAGADLDELEIYDAPACGGGDRVTLAAGSGIVAFELDEQTNPGPQGNWARPLGMQAGWDETSHAPTRSIQEGFKALTAHAAITNLSSNVVTCPNHRLEAGTAVIVTGLIVTSVASEGTCYAYPLSDHTLTFHLDQTESLSGTNPATLTNPIEGGGISAHVRKADASQWAMPGGREAFYYKGRLWLIAGRDQVWVSDVNDPLHCAPWSGMLKVNAGEADDLTGFASLGSDGLVLFKTGKIFLALAADNPETVTVTTLSDAYGCVAPLSICSVGNDVWFLSRKGIASVRLTEAGEQVAVAEPASTDMQFYVDRIDWNTAAGACGTVWNSRVLMAVPMTGQVAPAVNNAVLSCNLHGGDRNWEGIWQGVVLHPVNWMQVNDGGRLRVAWLDVEATVNCWDEEGGSKDDGEDFLQEVIGRPLSTPLLSSKLWLRGEWDIETLAPCFSLGLRGQGVGEDTWTEEDTTFDPTAYRRFGRADFVPSNVNQDFNDPGREDYRVELGGIYLGEGIRIDGHQAITRGGRCRLDERAVQMMVRNTAGSLRVRGWRAVAVAHRTFATTED